MGTSGFWGGKWSWIFLGELPSVLIHFHSLPSMIILHAQKKEQSIFHLPFQSNSLTNFRARFENGFNNECGNFWFISKFSSHFNSYSQFPPIISPFLFSRPNLTPLPFLPFHSSYLLGHLICWSNHHHRASCMPFIPSHSTDMNPPSPVLVWVVVINLELLFGTHPPFVHLTSIRHPPPSSHLFFCKIIVLP